MAELSFCCSVWAFSSCGEWGILFFVLQRLLIVVASLCCGAWALGAWASVVVVLGPSSCGSQALERRLRGCGTLA